MKIKFVCLFAIIASLFLSCKEADKNNNIGLMLLNQPSSTPKEEIPEIPEVEELKFSEGLEYELKDDDTLEVIGIGTCLDRNIIIPSEYEGKSVTSIAGYAFNQKTANKKSKIKSVVIPESITSVGIFAFAYCDYLEYVEFLCDEIPILDWTFYECNNLEEVKLPNNKVEHLSATFYNCSSLKNVVLPEKVKRVIFTFWNTGIESINIPDGLEVLRGPFHGCKNLKYLEIPESAILICGGAPKGVEINIKSSENWYYVNEELQYYPTEYVLNSMIEDLKPADFTNAEIFALLYNSDYSFIKIKI